MVSQKTAPDQTNLPAVTRSIAPDALREMDSFDAALVALADAGITVVSAADELGDGFELLTEQGKTSLVGVPFIVLDGTINPDGDFGSFVSLRVMTKDGRKVIINDGSTGINAQVTDFINRRGTIAGLAVMHGLRSSEFKFCEQCKNTKNKKDATSCLACGHSPLKPASTFYLDTSK